MNAFQLADLAALVSVHGRQLVNADPCTVDRSLAAYWKSSRCRLDRWGRRLRTVTRLSDRHVWSPEATGLVEEVFVSEILSRTIAALAFVHDEHHNKAEFAPIGRNVLSGHLDARRRAMALVTSQDQRGTDHADALLALRRQCDRWSDLVLAYLYTDVDVSDFAVVPGRVHGFAYDARGHLQSATSTNVALTMILAAGTRHEPIDPGARSRSSLARLSTGNTSNADLNLEIATAILSWFEPALFDSFGLLRSEWLDRLASVPDETLALLDQWWQPPPVVSELSSAARWRSL